MIPVKKSHRNRKRRNPEDSCRNMQPRPGLSSKKLNWLLQWKEQLGKPGHTLGKVLWTFLNNMDTSLDKLDGQMCWECWPADDGTKEFPELSQE